MLRAISKKMWSFWVANPHPGAVIAWENPIRRFSYRFFLTPIHWKQTELATHHANFPCSLNRLHIFLWLFWQGLLTRCILPYTTPQLVGKIDNWFISVGCLCLEIGRPTIRWLRKQWSPGQNPVFFGFTEYGRRYPQFPKKIIASSKDLPISSLYIADFYW